MRQYIVTADWLQNIMMHNSLKQKKGLKVKVCSWVSCQRPIVTPFPSSPLPPSLLTCEKKTQNTS